MRLIAVSLAIVASSMAGTVSASGQQGSASLQLSGVPPAVAIASSFTMTLSGSTSGASHVSIIPIYGQAPCAANAQAQFQASPSELIAHPPEAESRPPLGFAGSFTIHASVVGEAVESPGVYTLCVFMEAPSDPEAVESSEEASVIALVSASFTVLPAARGVSPTATHGLAAPARGCVVPSVKGERLAWAERAITRAHCAVGAVRKGRYKRLKKGRVRSQSPRPGKHLARGGRVSLVVGLG